MPGTATLIPAIFRKEHEERESSHALLQNQGLFLFTQQDSFSCFRCDLAFRLSLFFICFFARTRTCCCQKMNVLNVSQLFKEL